MPPSGAQGIAQPKDGSSDGRHHRRRRQEAGVIDISSTSIVPPASPSISSISEDVCWICAEPTKFYSVSSCNHRTCHFCALRLRALYQKRECAYCKVSLILFLPRFHCLQQQVAIRQTPQLKVIFTLSSSRPFEDYPEEPEPFVDEKLGVVFETEEMMEESLFLLRCVFSSIDIRLHI